MTHTIYAIRIGCKWEKTRFVPLITYDNQFERLEMESHSCFRNQTLDRFEYIIYFRWHLRENRFVFYEQQSKTGALVKIKIQINIEGEKERRKEKKYINKKGNEECVNRKKTKKIVVQSGQIMCDSNGKLKKNE